MARSYRRWVLSFFLLLISGVLVIGFLRPLSSLGRRVTLPLARWFSSQGQAVSEQAGGKTCLSREEKTSMEDRLSALAVDYARLRSLEEENTALRSQAKFLFGSGYDSVGARVIARDLRHERAHLLIDRGSDDALEVGQAVVVGDGIFVGKIISIRERIATVELATDPHSRIAASFVDDHRLMGVVEGRGNGTALMNYIPASDRVKKDRTVVTSGTEEKIPAQLPFGIVNDVLGSPNDPFMSAILEPLSPYERITFVSVLRPSALRPSL